MMYRVIAIVCASLALAACDSNPDWMKTPDWMKAPDFSNPFKMEPVQESVRVESEPPGAEAKATNGQSCRTPCALSLPDTATSVTFTLSGYQSDSEQLELIAMGDGTSQLRPNPLLVELTPLPPPPKKKVIPKKKKAAARAPAKPAAAKPAATAAPAPMMPQQQQAPAPWPTTPPPAR